MTTTSIVRDGNRAVAHGGSSTPSQAVVATQFARDETDYLAGPRDIGQIGRHVAGDQHELFVSCDPAEAVAQQLEHLRPEYIALHDLGTASTRQLLAGVAAASLRTTQRLVIRRQGYGTPLATLTFIDLPMQDGRALRMYTTDIDADTSLRHRLGRVMLAHSRLGVVMVGDLPTHLLKSSLESLRDGMSGAPWPNRHLLMLPLASSATLAQAAPMLAQGTGVQVRTTPQVTRPADAWNFISGAFNKLRDQDAVPGLGSIAAASRAAVPGHLSASSASSSASAPLPTPASPTTPASAPGTAKPASTAASPAAGPARPGAIPAQGSKGNAPASSGQATPPVMTPMPALRRGGEAPVESTLGRYVRLLSEVNGMISCCVFDLASGRPLVHAGARPGGDQLATQGAAMLAALGGASRQLGLGHALPEAAVTLGNHHLLLRAVPKHPGVALHAVLDLHQANPTLARLQIGRHDALFDEPTS